MLCSSAVLVPAAIDYRSPGYEQAERRRISSRLVAYTHAGLGRRRYALSACLTTSGSFRGVWVTIMVTRTRTVARKPRVERAGLAPHTKLGKLLGHGALQCCSPATTRSSALWSCLDSLPRALARIWMSGRGRSFAQVNRSTASIRIGGCGLAASVRCCTASLLTGVYNRHLLYGVDV